MGNHEGKKKRYGFLELTEWKETKKWIKNGELWKEGENLWIVGGGMFEKKLKWIKCGDLYKEEEKIRIVGVEGCEKGQNINQNGGII